MNGHTPTAASRLMGVATMRGGRYGSATHWDVPLLNTPAVVSARTARSFLPRRLSPRTHAVTVCACRTWPSRRRGVWDCVPPNSLHLDACHPGSNSIMINATSGGTMLCTRVPSVINAQPYEHNSTRSGQLYQEAHAQTPPAFPVMGREGSSPQDEDKTMQMAFRRQRACYHVRRLGDTLPEPEKHHESAEPPPDVQQASSSPTCVHEVH